MKNRMKIHGQAHGGSLFRLCQSTLEVVVTLTAALLLVATTTGAVAGTIEVTGFGSNPGNLRMFKYVPNLRATPALVVALHGCLQSASAYDDETGWTKFADKWGFALLLPEQKNANNSLACFTWFLPGDIERDKGEALSIKQMIDKMKTDHTIDPRRIYVTGLSAGGAMTAVMLATYPEIFAGGAIIAGLPYKCATSQNEARNSCMQPGKNLSPSEWGNRVRRATNNAGPWPKVSIWQGDADTTVNPMNATELMEQWTDVHGIDQIPEVQDAIKGYPHKAYQDANGNALVETYSITGMGHGTPVDPNGSGEDQCGKASAFILDKKICSSYYIAKFWGLDRIDQEAPSISIIAPVDGAEVSGVVAIRADAKDNIGVTKVEFYVDGRLRETDTAAPWEASWDTAREAKGTHTLLAKAFDAAGNVGSSNPISVKGGGVDDITSPTVNLTSPKNGDTVGGTVTLAAQANDDFGVSRVEFFVDNGSIGIGTSSDEAGVWQLPWDTTSVTSGSHHLSVKAFDGAGNAGIDDDTTVIINQNLLALEETFSDRDASGDLYDKVGWTATGWEASPDNHTVSPASSRSAFGYASSGIRCAIGKKTKSLSKRISLGDSPRLSYFRKLDLRAAVNISTVASFKVLVNDTVVDEKSIVGANYTEQSWTERPKIDLSAFANQTVTLTFEVAANSNVCIETSAKAWVDDITVGKL